VRERTRIVLASSERWSLQLWGGRKKEGTLSRKEEADARGRASLKPEEGKKGGGEGLSRFRGQIRLNPCKREKPFIKRRS